MQQIITNLAMWANATALRRYVG